MGHPPESFKKGVGQRLIKKCSSVDAEDQILPMPGRHLHFTEFADGLTFLEQSNFIKMGSGKGCGFLHDVHRRLRQSLNEKEF